MKARTLRRATAEKRPRWWIVPEIEKWFRGERDMPISALTFPMNAQLDELWSAWVEVHPDAVRPADWPPWPTCDRERQEAAKYLTRRKPRWYGSRYQRDFGKN
jgi:hypothetical protein